MTTMRIAPWLLVVAFAGCGSADGKDAPKAQLGGGSAAVGSAAPGSGSGSAGSAGGGAGLTIHKDTPEELAKEEDTGVPSYVPAEFKAGASRWKDTGVYVDGEPVGFLTFGELPVTLKPTWVKDKISAEKRPHSDDPGWRWAKTRFYKFDDLLKSLHVDPHAVNEMHVYGPKFSQAIIVKQKDIAGPLWKDFMFRFGVSVAGKALPHTPPGFANGKTPDKISSVMIYVKKKPPVMDEDSGYFMLDGKQQDGVPYYGEPVRGGVRIYMDDKLVTIIKRQELDVKAATKNGNGDMQWSFADFLKSKGVDTSKVVEGWLVHEERRRDVVPRDELLKASFAASAQAKGGVLFGDKLIKTNAITMFSRHLDPKVDLPQIDDDEEY